jgi:hypothetical protein
LISCCYQLGFLVLSEKGIEERIGRYGDGVMRAMIDTFISGLPKLKAASKVIRNK